MVVRPSEVSVALRVEALELPGARCSNKRYVPAHRKPASASKLVDESASMPLAQFDAETRFHAGPGAETRDAASPPLKSSIMLRETGPQPEEPQTQRVRRGWPGQNQSPVEAKCTPAKFFSCIPRCVQLVFREFQGKPISVLAWAYQLKSGRCEGVPRPQDLFLSNALAAEYKFDETGGTTAADSSGNNNNGTLINGPTFAPGHQGNALSFSGAEQDVQVPDSPSLDPTSAITISSWINATDWNGNRRILEKGGGPNQYRLTAEYGGLVFDLQGVGSIRAALPSTKTWHLVTGTYDGSHLDLYVDGNLVATHAASGKITKFTDPLVIGGKSTAGMVAGDFFKGLLDDTRIYTQALTASEVQTLFAST
jgi:hypothetical protein